MNRLRKLFFGLLGLALLPAVTGLGRTLYALLIAMQMNAGESRLLLRFALGAGAWVLAFLFLSRPVRLYVFAHELSHLLAAWLSGESAGDLRVGAREGSVTVSGSNLWIALAPYLIPFYSLLLLALHALAQLWWDPTLWNGALPAALGFTWCFHTTFTLYALSLGQSDIEPYGVLGALPVILAGNLFLICAAVMAVNRLPPETELWTLWEHQAGVYRQTADILLHVGAGVGNLIKNTIFRD